MFKIYRYNVADRSRDTYFKDFNNAKKALLDDLSYLTSVSSWTVTGHRAKFDSSKGFNIFDYELKNNTGEKITLSIIDGYFAD